jgi:hypothetical protein
MEEANLYRTLGELVAEVRELRRLIEANADQVDRRLTALENDMADLSNWRAQVKGGATAARWLWAAAGTGLGTAITTLLVQALGQ